MGNDNRKKKEPWRIAVFILAVAFAGVILLIKWIIQKIKKDK